MYTKRRLFKQCQCTNIKRAQGSLVMHVSMVILQEAACYSENLTIYELSLCPCNRYRGYVGVDAMVVEEFDGSIKAYLNDINPRLCGATPLIAMAHKVEAKLGRRPVGFTLKSHNIPLPEKCEDVFQAAIDLMGHHLYRGSESGYTGIVPVQVDVRPPHYDCFYLRSVAIARDHQHLRELQNVMDPSWSVDQSMSLASIEVIPGFDFIQAFFQNFFSSFINCGLSCIYLQIHKPYVCCQWEFAQTRGIGLSGDVNVCTRRDSFWEFF